jgi:hypothetical protein
MKRGGPACAGHLAAALVALKLKADLLAFAQSAQSSALNR